MSNTRRLALVALLATLFHAPNLTAGGGGHKRYFELINVSYDTVVSAAVAPAGDSAYSPIEIEPLRGGFNATTIAVSREHCVYDFRIGFRDGRTLRYGDINVCRSRGLYLRASDGRSPGVDMAGRAGDAGQQAVR